MPVTAKPSKKSTDINDYILANLDELNTSHLAKKPILFSKGLPFYTCIDSERKIWTKETKDGKLQYVKRHFDAKKDVMVDTMISTPLR